SRAASIFASPKAKPRRRQQATPRQPAPSRKCRSRSRSRPPESSFTPQAQRRCTRGGAWLSCFSHGRIAESKRRRSVLSSRQAELLPCRARQRGAGFVQNQIGDRGPDQQSSGEDRDVDRSRVVKPGRGCPLRACTVQSPCGEPGGCATGGASKQAAAH